MKVETLKNILVARATGTYVETEDYKQLRQELISSPFVKARLPKFVLTCRSTNEFWGFIKPQFSTYSERRDFLRTEFSDLLSALEKESETPSDKLVSNSMGVSSVFIQESWEKALQRRSSDPEGAITAARALLESVCKYILDSDGQLYEENADLPKLYSLVAKHLNLSPSQHTEQIFKQILGGCHTVVEGLGALRNRHGDAHGKSSSAVRPAPRHAELAVNLAGATATFLLQTMESRKQK